MTWEERVTQLEEQGLTRSDAQGAVDVEILEGWRPSDFQPWMLSPTPTGKWQWAWEQGFCEAGRAVKRQAE